MPVGVLGLHPGNAFEVKPEPLRVLHVIDSGTTGLAGDPTSPSSKLRKLLMEIGGSQKIVEDKNSGGSYGFGKAVYSASSRVAVVFAYSRTHDANGQPLSVLMGCAYHREHDFDGQTTSGRAFFGKRIEEHGIPIRHDPFVGDEADMLATELNMPREEGDIGTTIAIVDCPLNMEDIKRGVERSWWPKRYIENFKVNIVDENGQRLHAQPMKDPELKPFIDALHVALGTSPEQTGKSRKKTDFYKIEGKKIGQLGLYALPEDLEIDEMSDQADRRDTIALVRSPGMVVQYYRRGFPSHPPVVGVFLADDDIDDILRIMLAKGLRF